MTRRDAILAITATIASVPLVGCGSNTPELLFDRDTCDFCRMTISDRRFGAVAKTAGGRVARFDSIECLAAWTMKEAEQPRTVWVVDAMQPGSLRPLAEVRIHRAAPGRSPMGQGYVAVARTHGSTPWDGPAVSWDSVRAAAGRQSARLVYENGGR